MKPLTKKVFEAEMCTTKDFFERCLGQIDHWEKTGQTKKTADIREIICASFAGTFEQHFGMQIKIS